MLPYLERCVSSGPRPVLAYAAPDAETSACSGPDLIDAVAHVAGALQRSLPAQARVLILLPQGVEFADAFLGCLAANLVAVPLPLVDWAHFDGAAGKIAAILADCRPSAVITSRALAACEGVVPALDALPRIVVEDALSARAAPAPRAMTDNDIALLLYTSGSTAEPKGIVLSHRSLLAQSRNGANQWRFSESSRIVSWAPVFHNVGLRFNILSALLAGAQSTMLPPPEFVKRPVSWFEAISRHRATHTCAPNFAFDLCCETIDPDALDVSLSSLEGIFNGGEPVRWETCRHFARRFARLGLRADAVHTHYGLSEAGSVAASVPGEPLPSVALASTMVTSCGRIGNELIVVVAHDDLTPCGPSEVAEIRLASAAVGDGYFTCDEDGVARSDWRGQVDARGFLRTGDLGFIRAGHLYVVGREKDVMVIHGKNHHPVDIEHSLKTSLPALDLPIVVCSRDDGDRETVVVIAERAQSDPASGARLARDMAIAISRSHAIELHEVVLVPKGGIPRTASGKIERRRCRQAYLDGTLPVTQTLRRGPMGWAGDFAGHADVVDDTVVARVIDIVAAVLGLDASAIDGRTTFAELGLDSVRSAQIAARVEDAFQIRCDVVRLFKHADAASLAGYIAGARVVRDGVQEAKEHASPSTSLDGPHAIAVVGIACSFPGQSGDPDTLWRNLVEQRDCIRPIPDSRTALLDSDAAFPRWGGFIDDIDAFDAAFFRVSRVEAEAMDPQQRKMLELTWSVIESAGYNPRDLEGKEIGMFVGVHGSDYAELATGSPSLAARYGAYLDSGLHSTLVANRVSRWYDFRGPSEAVNTACSSSLVALEHAVRAITNGDCSAAIAAGINLICAPRVFIASTQAGMLAPDGRCKTFSAAADGFVRSEGYGAVLLKPYADAVRDGDPIHGIIRGAAVCHEGRSQSLRAPNVDGQRRLLLKAYRRASVPIESVTYVEAHGTGTALGDPIEVQALREAFQELNPGRVPHRCGLGTIKTNIGHCESAAGMAGFIKVLLAMQHGVLPASLHFERLNPHIDLDGSPFYIVDRNTPWSRVRAAAGRELPRRAGISSFGFGGVNAHVIVEEHMPGGRPSRSRRADDDQPAIVPLSARTRDSLRDLAERLRRSLFSGTWQDQDLPDIAYTLQTGREAMRYRVVFRAASIGDLTRRLDAFLAGELEPDGDAMCREWVDGKRVDWSPLYADGSPKRIALPTYPFAKDRFWLSEGNSTYDLTRRRHLVSSH